MMFKTGYGKRKTVSCNRCGKPISFVRTVDTAIPVEPEGVYFVPQTGGEKFILSDGSAQYGIPASDGLRGFKKHNCSRALIEKGLSGKSC